MKTFYLFTNLWQRLAAVMCLILMVSVAQMWATVYTYDFTTVNNFYTTAGGNTHPGTGSGNAFALNASFYASDGACFTVLAASKVYFNSGYIMVGNTQPILQLPTYPGEKITQIKLWNSSGCSISVKVAIKSGSSTASAQQTWSTKSSTYTYTIGDAYQATTLKMDVTSANAQITKMEIITIGNCNQTQLDIPEVTATPSNGQVQLTWPAVANATKYQVSWNGGAYADATSPFTKSSLTNGTSYTWAVRAIGNGSTYCSSDANEGSTKPSSTIRTITWKVYGESDITTKVADGDHLVLPASPSSCEVGKVFAGWSATNIGGTPTDTKPTFVSSQTTISSNQTYYAVFATREANSYTKGDINDLFPGQTALIVNETNNKALSDTYVDGYQNKELQSEAITISSSKITSMSNSHLIWTVENRGQKFNFKTGTGCLLATGSVNTKLACCSGSDPWTLTSAGSNKYYMNSNNSGTNRLEYYSTYDYFTTYASNTTDAYKMSFFVPTCTQYFTSCASCTEDPTVYDVTIDTSFKLTALSSTGSAVGVSSNGSPGTNCSWTDYGIVWSATNPPTVTHNKSVISTSGTTSSFGTQIMPSGSTTPTAWVVGTPYYVRTYGKNSKDGAEYVYSENTASFTLRSITFHSNGGTSVGPWYVNSGGTYEAPTAPTKDGFVFGGWYTDDGTFENPVNWSAAVSENKDYYARWFTYGDYVFSCAELTLTPHLVTEGAPIFITSTAEKTVRSQDSIQITGSGLTPSTALTFPGLNGKFEIKTSTGGTISTDASGDIDVAAYIFYTPGDGDTSDGLDKMTGISVSVSGAKQKSVNLTQDIIGRHLPSEFVIAAKKNDKWYALTSNIASTSHPLPIEIAVDDISNPSIAYTASENKYGLEGPTASNISGGNGQYVKLTMSAQTDGTGSAGPAPLFGTNVTEIGKSGVASATSNLSAGWWWKLQQENTSITNPQDAKYKIYCANNTKTLSLRDNAGNPDWGLFASGVEELRLIQASSVEYTEAEVVAWGQKKLILEIEKPDLATQARAKIGDGSWSGNKSLATTTGTSVKGTATKYNYTLDFTSDDFDFADADNEGKMLIIELLNSGGTALKASSVIVPRIVAADRTIKKSSDTSKTPWKTEVHVLPGVTLTLDASGYDPTDMTFEELNIYPGATVVAEKGTLKATTLVLRNGWDRLSATKKYDVARLYITPTTGSLNAGTAYLDWYIDYDQYYPIAVPFPVATSSISYKNTSSTATAGVRVRYYDGDKRAKNVQQNQDENWVEYTWGGTMPTNLEPSKGYVMTAKRPTGKAFSIVRMPLTIASSDWTAGGEKGEVSGTHKDQVSVTEHKTSTTPEYAKGWNLIANPYMSLHQGELSLSYTEGSTTVEYANIPDINFKEYDQLPIATTKLKPSSAFLIQAPKTGTVTFSTDYRKASAPSSYRNADAITSIPTQRAYILLGDEQAEDMMGILVSENYTAEYETNADLEKLLSDGNTLRTYMRYANMNMAYLAINEELAKEWIPVSVRIPADGEYTFKMHEASVVGELEGVYLIDYASGDKVTNLLYENYTFTAEAGTDNSRFAINAVVGVHKTPTGLDISGTDKDGPTKFIYHDKVYILHNNVIYDSTGKRVNVINK